MKKLFYLLLVAGLGLTVAACGSKNTTTTTTTTTTTVSTAEDKVAPRIELVVTEVEVMKGEQSFDAYANIKDAFDNMDKSITKDSVEVDLGGYEGIDTEKGTYTITYSVKDFAGNESTATCVVTVIDVEPTLILNSSSGVTYTWPMNYNPILGAQYTQTSGFDQWAYELTKVTVLTKDYFEYVEEAVYERISASWSFVMITDENLEIVYARDHYTNEYYYEEGVVVYSVGENWCTGTSTGLNTSYCDVTTGRQMANLSDEDANDYAKIPDGGYVIIFINNGANDGYDCPRGFGQRIVDESPSSGGVGVQLQMVGAGKEFGPTTAPAYVKTATDKTVIDAYYGDTIDIMDGISYVSYNKTNLTVTAEIYPVVNGAPDLANKLTAIDTTAPAEGADGKIPDSKYIVKYSVEENGKVDYLTRVYNLRANDQVVQSYRDKLTFGSASTLIYYNNPEGVKYGSSGLGMSSSSADKPHLYDTATLINLLKQYKEANPTQNAIFQYGAYFVLDKDLKVIQFVFAIGTDQLLTKDAEGKWTSTALATGSKHNLYDDFLGDNPLIDLNKAAFILFTQNGANNTTVRQFGVNLWSTQGTHTAAFDQQELLNTTAAVVSREGLNSAGKVLEDVPYSITSGYFGPDGTAYDTTYNDDNMWKGGNADLSGNTNVRVYAEKLHFFSKDYVAKLDVFYAYVPWASMVVLDENLKVVAVRAFYEAAIDGQLVKIYYQFTKDQDGNVIATPFEETPWGTANDACEEIDSLIPEGGYAFPLITNAAITNPILEGILGDLDVTNPVINDYQFTIAYKLVIA